MLYKFLFTFLSLSLALGFVFSGCMADDDDFGVNEQGVALSYPYTTTVNTYARTMNFSDGLRISYPANTFSGAFSVTISKAKPVALTGIDNVSDAYKIVYNYPRPSPFPPTPDEFIDVTIPTDPPVSSSDTHRMFLNFEDFSDPDEWFPTDPTVVYCCSGDFVKSSLSRLIHFQVMKM